MIDCLTYVSRAAPAMSARDAYDIIRASHNRNSRTGLTGALLFLDGWFLQILEGDAFYVDRCYASIAVDPRHHALELRERLRLPERRFPNEWMALRLDCDVSADLRLEHGYVPGFPAQRFDPAALLRFVHAVLGATALQPHGT